LSEPRRGAEGASRHELEELRQELARCRADAARYRAILESAVDYAIFTIDPDGRVASWNSGAQTLLGWEPEEAVGLDSRLLFTPEDRAGKEPEGEMAMAAAEGRAENERWHVRKDGSRFWGSGLMLPLREEETGGFLKIMRDRTTQRQGAERQSLLLRELAHRVKNTLALTLSMARQTGSKADDVASFLESFEGRLRALAAAHDLLTDSGWLETSLPALVETALAAHAGFGDGRFEVALDDLPIEPALAQDLVLALHELATNAAKHGALSHPDGRVTLEGRARDGMLVLSWRERGGPAAAAPRVRGFGTTLLERVVAHQHRGVATLEWRPEGLACTLRLPLAPLGDRPLA